MANATQAPQQWGITPPVSMNLPTAEELKLNEDLIAELKRQDNFEAPEDTERRKQVLIHFQRVTEEFVRRVGKMKAMAPSVIENAGGKVSTFGSYRLGVYGPGSDIDTLIVAPRHVTREDFFIHFPNILTEMSPAGAIEENTPVPDAHVPIMKLEYSGISIDLLFVRLALSSVPTTLDLKDNTLLRGLDDVDLRSINGVRVTDEILSLVPQVKAFRQALRTVKLWAQRRAIYSNITGFPGGVAWAMMVARVCQLYPMATGAVIVSKFFHLIATWQWPRPIQLKHYEKGPLEVREWNPSVYPHDRRHLMPVITPAYPSMCATNNITKSTMEVIVRELRCAESITGQIFLRKQTWKDLFQKHTFFTEGYKYYLSVISASRSKEAQQIWSGLVQSKVRRLVGAIENSDTGVGIAHPYIKGFERIHKCKTEEEVDSILHGELKYQVKKTTDENKSIKQSAAAQDGGENVRMPNGAEMAADGTMTIYTTTYYVGLELDAGEVTKKLDISFPVADFKRICIEWGQYDPGLNYLCTIHTRSYDLPEDVFEPGEKRPVKAKKGKGAKGAKGAKAVNGMNQAQGGLTPVPRSNEQSPTRVAAIPLSKKRALDNEAVEMNNAKRRQSPNSMVTPTPAG